MEKKMCVEDCGNIETIGTGRDLSVTTDNAVSIDNSNHSIRKMYLNEFGKIAHKQWEWLANQYSYVVLHSFIVMPNLAI